MATDRRILIDNSTLSGVERILGISKIANLNNIGNDILCLEKLVTAILFSDRLMGIDDYKEEYRSRRLREFNFIDFVKLENESYTEFSNMAAEFARDMTFSFEGSQPAGDVVRFFDALRIDPQMRWNIFCSSEYLTLSYLVDDPRAATYERHIDSAFRTECTDSSLVESMHDTRPKFKVSGNETINDVKDFVHILGSKNPYFSGVDGKSALERIVFGYGWAAERSYFYNLIAAHENYDVYLAPLRDAFCESCLRIDNNNQIISLIEALKTKSQEALISILEPTGRAKFATRLPFFTAYLISKTDNPKHCIEYALALRETEDVSECRTIFHNLQHLTQSEKTQELNGILKYLDQSCNKLMKRYAVSTENGPQFSISVGIAGPSASLSGKTGSLFRAYKNRPFSRVFRNIAQDMINVERLGGLYEKVCSSMIKTKDATYAGISTTPRYMKNKVSQYGKPAKL